MTIPTGWDGPKYFAAQLAPEPVRTDWSPPTGEPGIIQPHPLSFGDILGGVFRAVRYAPGTMFGLTVILTLAAQLLGMGVGYLVGQELGVSLLPGTEEDGGDLSILTWSGLAGMAATTLAELVIGIGLSWATFQAINAHRVSPLEAARRIGSRLWAMLALYALPLLVWGALGVGLAIGLAPLTGSGSSWVLPAIAIPLGIAALVVTVMLSIRLLLAPSIIAIEGRGPIAAITRSWFLTKGSFWRIFGTYAAISVLISMATSVISTVFMFVGTLITVANAGVGATVLMSSSTITSAVFSLPLTTALATLIYVDARMRREAYDLELSEKLFG